MSLTFADKVVIFFCTLFVLSLYYFFWVGSSEASQLEIYVNGEKRYIYNLSENNTISVEGKLGESVLEVAEGKVRFIQSPCNTQFCIRSGWHEHAGGLAACLPNGVSVHLTGAGKIYDAINF